MRMIDEYERSLIGGLLTNPGENVARAMEQGVDLAWFTDDRWSLMWSAIEGFWKRGDLDSLSPITARAEAQRLAALPKERRTAEALTVQALEEAIDSAPTSIGQTLTLLRNAAIERRAKDAIASSFKEFPVYADSTDVVVLARNKLDAVLSHSAAEKKFSPRVIFNDLMAEYEQAYQMRVAEDGPRDLRWTPGYKMPWPKMTESLNGLRAGLHVIAARPSVGKTSFAVNLMRFWSDQGYKVLFNSLDMPREEALRRFVAERSRVSIRKAAFSPTRTDLDAMRRAIDEMMEGHVAMTETRDVDELRTLCMIDHAAGRLDILVVDYLQLLHARSLGKEDAIEYARVSYVSDTLKRLANELRIPVIALAQLNREVTKQDAAGRLPGLADLRGSGSIEQDAFTVTILHRDEQVAAKWRKGENIERALRLVPGTVDNPQYKYNLNDLDPIWWILAKNQNGPTGKLPFVVRKKYFAWMLADYEAEPVRSTTGYGATQREQVDNSPLFERVHSDWRHDPVEETLRLQLALIQDGEDVANEALDI